ncbi:integral membrane protein, partial [Aureobasidium melanogenum]
MVLNTPPATPCSPGGNIEVMRRLATVNMPSAPTGLKNWATKAQRHRDNTCKYDNPVSADAMDKQTNSNIGKSSRHRSRQETKSSTQGSIALNVLEEKVGVLLESVESSPDAKDVKAYTGESFVLPKRVGYKSWTAEAFLTSDPENESTKKNEREDKQSDINGLLHHCQIASQSTATNHGEKPTRKDETKPINVSRQSRPNALLVGGWSGRKLPGGQNEHEEVDDSSNMETPLPADGSSKHTTQDHADAKTEGLGSAHHSENDVSLLAGRKDFIDETNSRW